LAFTIAKRAFCYAFFEISTQIFGTLHNQVDSEWNYFWLKSLLLLSDAEFSKKFNSLVKVLNFLRNSLTNLNAVCSPYKNTFQFQKKILKLRIQFF